MSAHAGFDTSGFPGLAVMAKLKSDTNLEWCGFYLKAPSHPDDGWISHRDDLVAQGWGLAPIYVGQQVTGPGSHDVTAVRGKIDGADAAAKMKSAGFPPGSCCFLDLENGLPFPTKQQQYMVAWCDALQQDGFSPGVYCSFRLAAKVQALRPDARLWVFKVPTTKKHNVNGNTFPAPDPSGSSIADAHMWQRDMAGLITIPGGNRLEVDLDTAISADPSSPPAVGASPARAPLPAPKASIALLQRNLNKLGASPALDTDGVFGPDTIAAVEAFQTAQDLTPDGIVGPETRAAIKTALAALAGRGSRRRRAAG